MLDLECDLGKWEREGVGCFSLDSQISTPDAKTVMCGNGSIYSNSLPRSISLPGFPPRSLTGCHPHLLWAFAQKSQKRDFP